jgi:dihydroxyacetone kinase-like predicted kinase
MDLQHEGAASPSLDGSSNIGIVTVAQSAESARLFTNLGAARVVRIEGGESPTVDQMLSAVQSIGYEHVLLLPNNENALLAAEQARDLSPRSIEIIATRNVAEAVACMVAFNYVGDVDENVAGMREALRRLETLDVARATRAAAYPHVNVEVGDCVVLSRGEVASSAPALGAAMRGVLTCRRDDAPELITIYTGAEASVDSLECIRTAVSEQWPAAEIQIVDTRQPRRLAILALE